MSIFKQLIFLRW